MFPLVLLSIASYITPGFSQSFCFVAVNNAPSCTSCDPNATCQRGNPVICECNAGFFGNGLACKTTTQCTKINCCGQGYEWNSTSHCCDQKYCGPACANDEICQDATRDTHCLCNPLTYAGYVDTDIVPILSCQSAAYTISVSKCLLEALHLNSSFVHLNDQTCIGAPVIIGDQRMISISVNQNVLECGTAIKSNATHVIFSNVLILEPTATGSIKTGTGKMVAFSCAYPINKEITIDPAINPIVGYTTLPSIVGSGSYIVKMVLFQNADFSNPYTSGSINLTVGSPLYIGAYVQDAKNTSLALVMDTCYATPANNIADTTRFVLLQNGCPVVSNTYFQIIENGVGPEIRFVTVVLKFINGNQFYLTCDIHLCDNTHNDCKPKCPASKAQIKNSNTAITFGPVYYYYGNSTSSSTDKGDSTSSSTGKEFPLMQTIFSTLMLLTLNRILD
ncbi:uromodulin-like [Protopterus annectens]|uniref:uromodulin-like n=1 Tax=Protopterus annectens TaxID=7888 RepID=UPI001CF9A562|nr:uromodulin-like [Protopterus annectens]